MLNEQHTQTRKRVAAREAVQDRHDKDLIKLSNKIDGLADDFREGIPDLGNKIKAVNTIRSRVITAATSDGATISGGVAVGLYQIIHVLYPHCFGGWPFPSLPKFLLVAFATTTPATFNFAHQPGRRSGTCWLWHHAPLCALPYARSRAGRLT